MFVPTSLWEHIFLVGMEEPVPQCLIVIENTLVAPFVAVATFIGSMGNIPFAGMRTYRRFFNSLELEDEAKEGIAWRNAARLFKLDEDALTSV